MNCVKSCDCKERISKADKPGQLIEVCEKYLYGAIPMDGQTLKIGEKKDDGKPRWELLAYDAIDGIAQTLTLGARKYESRNWELGIEYGRVFGAIQRHLSAFWRGESTDLESGLSHLDHALTELMFLSAYEKRGMKQFDDRPNTIKFGKIG